MAQGKEHAVSEGKLSGRQESGNFFAQARRQQGSEAFKELFGLR
jgi:hypothetical protein